MVVKKLPHHESASARESASASRLRSQSILSVRSVFRDPPRSSRNVHPPDLTPHRPSTPPHPLRFSHPTQRVLSFFSHRRCPVIVLASPSR